MTDYLILKATSDPRAKADEPSQRLWVQHDRKNASSPKAAIRSSLKGAEDASGDFVAIPYRSWQPVSVQVEQALKFS